MVKTGTEGAAGERGAPRRRKSPRRTGRPTRAASARLADRLVEAAAQVFLDRGFDGATMDAIARAAGVTRRTLYAHYPTKEAVFSAAVRHALSHQQEPPAEPSVSGEDLAEALTIIAREAVARAVDPDTVRLQRMAMAESGRFPEFSQSAHTLMWSPRMRRLVELLDRHARGGAIVVRDVELAAEQFLAMVSLMPGRLAAFGVHRDPEDEERHIAHAVELFLSGLRPR